MMKQSIGPSSLERGIWSWAGGQGQCRSKIVKKGGKRHECVEDMLLRGSTK